MTAVLTVVAAAELTTGSQLFRCEPYNCTMLARACVERQAKADLGLDAITLLKCKGCELRRDFTATVTLPTDLTSFDIQRLTRFLAALVFEDASAAE